jgi:hypothetical protein
LAGLREVGGAPDLLARRGERGASIDAGRGVLPIEPDGFVQIIDGKSILFRFVVSAAAVGECRSVSGVEADGAGEVLDGLIVAIRATGGDPSRARNSATKVSRYFGDACHVGEAPDGTVISWRIAPTAIPTTAV